MKKINPEKIMKKELKEKMENKLLIIMAFCMVAYIAMLFTYRGFLSTSFILMMKNIMYVTSGIFLAGAIALAVMYFMNKVEDRTHLGSYAIVTAVVGLSALFVSKFNIHGVKILAVALTVYLLDAIIYYSYYVEFLTKRKLLNILFGSQFIIICAGWFVLLNKLKTFTITLWSIMFPVKPLADASAMGINIGIGVLIGLLGIFFIVRGLVIKDRKKAIVQ